MLAKPAARFSRAWRMALHDRPEGCRMAPHAEMRQLMDDDRIEHERWRQDEPPAEREVALGRCGGPPAALVSDAQSPAAHAQLGRPGEDTLMEPGPRAAAEPRLERLGDAVLAMCRTDKETAIGQL